MCWFAQIAVTCYRLGMYNPGVFVVCFVVGFEVHEVDSNVIRFIISVLCKLQHVSNHV